MQENSESCSINKMESLGILLNLERLMKQ